MNEKEIKEVVYKKLKNKNAKNISEKSEIKDLGIDSFDFIELLTELEEKWDIEISDKDLKKIKTLKDVINTIKKATN